MSESTGISDTPTTATLEADKQSVADQVVAPTTTTTAPFFTIPPIVTTTNVVTALTVTSTTPNTTTNNNRDEGKEANGGEGEAADKTGDDNDNIEFQPIVSLPLVEIKTMEEEELEVMKLRAKLYRFDSSESEWKERGIGEVKILKNPVTNQSRILMRQDKTLKLCANHYITPVMELKPHSNNSDKVFVWSTLGDYSDSDVPKPETLCIRFGSAQNASLFKDAVESAKDWAKRAADEKNSLNLDLEKLKIGNNDDDDGANYSTITNYSSNCDNESTSNRSERSEVERSTQDGDDDNYNQDHEEEGDDDDDEDAEAYNADFDIPTLSPEVITKILKDI